MFVKSVVSRAGRVVVSVDQLRVVLRVKGDLIADRHNEEMYERLLGDFANYLVSEPEQHIPAVPDLPIWRGLDGRIVAVGIGQQRVRGLVGDDGVGGERIVSMDAPEYMAAGSMLADMATGEVCAYTRAYFRDRWFE